MLYLKQSTASQAVLLGPFVDDTDGATAETGLTVANTDIRLSANGGNMFAKTSGGGTHDENGWYTITLDATDTATVGRLQISSKVAGALAVFMECQVLEEAVYDDLFAASAAGYAGITELAAISTTIGTAGDGLTAINLPNQTMDITGNLSGSVGSVTGAVGSVTGAVGSVAGNVDGSTASVTGAVGSVTGAVGSVTGAVGSVAGNVDGSTASVVGAVGSVTGNVGGSVASVTAEVTADMTKISGSATAADNLELSALTTLPFTVTGTPTSTEVAASGLTAITGGDDMLIGRVIIFTSGNAQYEAARITDYVDATGTMTVTTLAITPAATDTGIII